MATQATTTVRNDSLLQDFERLNGRTPAWVGELRHRAFARFRELGFPSTRLEEWKYTDVGDLAKRPLRLDADRAPEATVRDALRAAGIDSAAHLVFVDGHLRPELSTARPPENITVTNLALLLREQPELLKAHLARHADVENHHFSALNTAFLRDGAVVLLPPGERVSDPIHLVYFSSGTTESRIAHPRTLVVAGDGSEAVLVETYAGDGDAFTCTNALTEIDLGADAGLKHYRVQQESGAAYHIGTVHTRQAKGSRFSSFAVSLGGALARADISTVLDGEGASCSFDGLYLADGNQHVDHHTSIDHRQPRCTSRQMYKGVLDGRSSAVFNGKVFVRPDAQKSDAAQMNKNLLLSDTAVIDTKPQLEIFADDVRCSHGATIGRLDEEAAFYLRSRGIGRAEARAILVYAFANELIERIEVEPLRARLRQALAARLGQGSDPAGT